MAGGYSKLFGSIVTSSIWCEENTVLRVWIAMLATCDAKGVVEGSVPGFASLARVSISEMEHALGVLMSPDPHSRTKAEEGRRVLAVPGGWKIVNYELHRNKLQEKQGSRAADMRRSREKKAQGAASDVTRYKPLPGVTNAASAYPGTGDAVRTDGTTAGAPDWAPPLPEEAIR